MKPNIVTSVLLLLVGFGAAEVMAQTCSGTFLTGAQLVSTLNGKYVCAKRPPNGDTWNEFHRGVGTGPFPIIDYKRGPADPVDPSEVVGTYKIDTTNNTVTYDYGSGGQYTFRVRQTPNPNPASPGYLFCNANEAIPAIISTSPTHALCNSP
jgi:hypothetical protein